MQDKEKNNCVTMKSLPSECLLLARRQKFVQNCISIDSHGPIIKILQSKTMILQTVDKSETIENLSVECAS